MILKRKIAYTILILKFNSQVSLIHISINQSINDTISKKHGKTYLLKYRLKTKKYLMKAALKNIEMIADQIDL